MAHIFLTEKDIKETDLPLSPSLISKYQGLDKELKRRKYGHLPTKEAEELPWSRVNVDLIGPYIVRTPTATHTLRALTMIDPVTGWFEIIAVQYKTKTHILSWKRSIKRG